MQKETKNILCAEYIEKELRFLNKANIRSSLALLVAMMIIFIPLSAIMINVFLDLERKTFFTCVFSFGTVLIFFSPILLFLYNLIRALREKQLIKRGEWVVVTDELLYKTEEVIRRHIETFLFFAQYGKVVTNSTTYQLAEQGDIFYLVMYKKRKSVLFHYSQKMYEYNS